MNPVSWANGFGVWHVRVSRHAASPLIAARRVLRDELTQRENNVAREVWMRPVRVPELDTDDTVVYKEGSLTERVTCRDCGLGGYQDAEGVYGDRDVEPCPRGGDDFHHWVTT